MIVKKYLKFHFLFILSLMIFVGCDKGSNRKKTKVFSVTKLSINGSLLPISSANASEYLVWGACHSALGGNGNVSIVIGEPITKPVEVPCRSNTFSGYVDTRQITSKKATITVTHKGNKQSVTVDNNLILIPIDLSFKELSAISSSNMADYNIKGTCDSNLGDVTVVIGEPNVEKILSCTQDNTFSGNFDVQDISSHPAVIKASQSDVNFVAKSSVTNEINHFVTKWRIPEGDFSFTLPLKESSSLKYNFTVDWGDQTAVSEVTSFQDTDKRHTYAKAGEYTMRIIGTCEGFENTSVSSRNLLFEVVNFGNMGWKDLSRAFKGNSLLKKVLGGNMSAVTNMKNMFHRAVLAIPDTNGWDTSMVKDMRGMFLGTTKANPNTSSWNTSKVVDMANLFRNAAEVNPDTSGWDTSMVKDMKGMFLGAIKANPDVSGWDTSKVTNMENV